MQYNEDPKWQGKVKTGKYFCFSAQVWKSVFLKKDIFKWSEALHDSHEKLMTYWHLEMEGLA